VLRSSSTFESSADGRCGIHWSASTECSHRARSLRRSRRPLDGTTLQHAILLERLRVTYDQLDELVAGLFAEQVK
jgi:hypothetical protein